VMKFGVETQVGTAAEPVATMQAGNIIVNPEVRRSVGDVFAFDPGVLGAASQQLVHDGSYYSGTQPRLNQTDVARTPISRKFDMRTIEVTYERQLIVGVVPSPTLAR